MSNSSKAFEKLLKDGNYFNEKILDFLQFKGNKKKTGEIAAEFLCNFDDKRSDIVQAVKSIKDVFTKIEASFESGDAGENPSGITFRVGTFGKDGKDYLYRLFELFKIDHKIFLYCLDRKWERVLEKLEEMEHRKKGKEIIDEFDLGNDKSSLYILSDCCNIAIELDKKGKLDELTLKSGIFRNFKKNYSRYSKEVKKLFPSVAELFDTEAPPSKRRRLNPSEDD